MRLGNVFNRSGLASLSDLNSSGYKYLFSRLEKEQDEFLKKESEFRSKKYKWTRDPLHDWSRLWEYPYVYRHLANHLKTIPENSIPLVADVGSGVTFFPFSLAKLGYQVVCTDIDRICERDLSLARACVPHSPGTVEFRLIENSSIPLKDSECDALYCISVLEHIHDLDKAVSEMARILKPGGLCLITCDINLRPDDGLQLDYKQYRLLLSFIEQNFVRIWPEITVHPVDVLTTENSAYPLIGLPAGVIRDGYRFIKHRILKPFFGRNPLPHLAVLGLVLRKKV